MLSLSAAALNHLLEQSGWAMQRLQKYAGKTARFNIAPFSFAFYILPNGSILTAEQTEPADCTCIIPPSLLPRLALQDEHAFSQIETQGDSALLGEIFNISKNLQWDMGEDLSRFMSDSAAERLVQFAGIAKKQLIDNALNISQAFAEYWTEERPLVAKSTHIQQFIQQVDTLRDDIARLEQRINRL